MQASHVRSTAFSWWMGIVGMGLLTSAVSGCGTRPSDPGGGSVYPQAQTLVQFDVPRGDGFSEFLSVPFPSHFRQKADGTLDLSKFPNDSSNALVTNYLTIIAENTRGFGTNGGFFVRLTGAIDPVSLPQSAAASMAEDASVFLVDVDPSSPARGRRFPLRFKFSADKSTFLPANTLTALPVFGFPLRSNTLYAGVVSRDVRDASGVNIGPSPEFEILKSLSPVGDETLEGTRAVYAPVFDFLEGLGVARDRVAAIALYRTQDALGEMDRIYRYVMEKENAPVVSGVEFKGEYRLPNSTEPPYHLYRGFYSTPNYQIGEKPYSTGGAILFNEAGEPIRQKVETIPFELSVPRTVPPPGGFPVVLFAHGTGGDERTFRIEGIAARLAATGIATIGIPQPLHGSRYSVPQGQTMPTGRELKSAIELAFFNYLNPIAGLNNVRQSAIDEFQRVRMVRNLKIDAPVSNVGVRIYFNADKFYFMGHSQGGFTGPLFLALEPSIKGAVLSGAGAAIAVGMLTKRQPVDVKSLIMLGLGIPQTETFDEFNILVNLVQTYFERSDAMNYAPRIVESPPSGTPKNILMTEGLKDDYAPPASVEALAIAIGVTPVIPVSKPVEGLALKGRLETAKPLRGNVKGAATAALIQYPDGDHWVALNDAGAIAIWKRFFETLVADGVATIE